MIVSHTAVPSVTRRRLVRQVGLVSVALAATSLVAACGAGTTTALRPTSSSATSAATTAAQASPTTASGSSTAVGSNTVATAHNSIAASTAAVPVSGAVSLVFSTWGAGGDAFSAEHQVVAAFNKAHPEIQAQVLEIPFNTYRDKLLASLAGGDAPDNMAIDHDMFPFMVQKDVFARLDPLVSRDKTALDDYIPSALTGMSYQGVLYGLPTGGSAYYLFWSPRLFQQAGLTSPNDLMAKDQWTWQAFLDAAQKLTQGDGGASAQYGADTGLSVSAIAPWVWSGGGSYLSSDQQQVELDQPAAIDAIQFLHDLIWKEHVAPQPGVGPGGIKSFIAGKLAMHLDWGGTGIAQFAPVKDLSWDLALPPAKDGKSFVSWAPLNPMTINKQAKHPEQSWTFEVWYNGAPGMEIFSANGRVPVARSVLTSAAYLKPPPDHKQIVLQGIEVGKPAFTNPNWTLASEKLTPFLTDIQKNTMPVADAMKQAVALANPILAGKI
jgi:multiple sugar transport system substrate-binding protein